MRLKIKHRPAGPLGEGDVYSMSESGTFSPLPYARAGGIVPLQFRSMQKSLLKSNLIFIFLWTGFFPSLCRILSSSSSSNMGLHANVTNSVKSREMIGFNSLSKHTSRAPVAVSEDHKVVVVAITVLGYSALGACRSSPKKVQESTGKK